MVPEESPPSNLEIDVEDENVIVDYSAGGILEEVVVTIDDTDVLDVLPETDTDSNMFLAPEATVLVPGGTLPNDPTETSVSEKVTFMFKDPNFIVSVVIYSQVFLHDSFFLVDLSIYKPLFHFYPFKACV